MVDSLVRFAEEMFHGREGGADMGKAQAEGQNRHQGNPHHIPPSFYVIFAACRHHLSSWCCIRSAKFNAETNEKTDCHIAGFYAIASAEIPAFWSFFL
ncbi:MAG: hypothetical protein ABR512_13055 [Desulfopila sp.]